MNPFHYTRKVIYIFPDMKHSQTFLLFSILEDSVLILALQVDIMPVPLPQMRHTSTEPQWPTILCGMMWGLMIL